MSEAKWPGLCNYPPQHPFHNCLTFGLPQRVHHLYVHGAMGQGGQVLGAVAGKLVCEHDGVLLPVGPVQVAFESGHGKHVRHQEAVTYDRAPPTAIDSCHANVIQVAVRPENCAGDVINGQRIWPGHVVLWNRREVRVACRKGRGCSFTQTSESSLLDKQVAVLSHKQEVRVAYWTERRLSLTQTGSESCLLNRKAAVSHTNRKWELPTGQKGGHPLTQTGSESSLLDKKEAILSHKQEVRIADWTKRRPLERKKEAVLSPNRKWE